MTINICVVYHSGYGHTLRVAGSVTNSECRLISAQDLTESSPLWNELDNKDAVIFGSPT